MEKKVAKKRKEGESFSGEKAGKKKKPS